MAESPVQDLPPFDLDGYRTLLRALLSAGVTTAPVGRMREEHDGPVVFVRHDVDFFPAPAVAFAEAEAALGVTATYYFLLTGPYNLHAPAERSAVQRIAALGHEVGLHYDLETWPTDPALARDRLDAELRALADLSGQPVRTLSTHNPHQGGADPFRELDELVHPHDPRDERGLAYVSDSCRGWRDEALLRWTLAPPPRAMLLTHPELWLDSTFHDRLDYLERVVLPRATQTLERYFRDAVHRIWREHDGGRAHDRRVGITRDDELRIEWPDRTGVHEALDAVLARFAEFVEVPWTREQVLAELPGKWEVSALAWRGESLVGMAFNSVREGELYVHAFFTAPSARRRGLGAQLMTALTERARGRGIGGVRLKVDQANTRAIRFYLAQGFHVAGADPERRMLELLLPVGDRP
jgi:ribosomal protein S18 acetylase RimI-like enzyme